MILLIRENSALIAGFLLVSGAGWLLLRHKRDWLRILALGGVMAALAGGWYLGRPVQTEGMNELQRLQAVIGKGTPVLLEFQSPY